MSKFREALEKGLKMVMHTRVGKTSKHMETIKVKILPDGISAKEINQATNPTMGIRHTNYESILRTFIIEGQDNPLTRRIGGIPDTIHDAEILENGNIKIV